MFCEPTVFVVDDDEASRESVKALVRSMGMAAETFASAEEFLANFDSQRAGCLVTDLRMAGMSGVELQEKLTADEIRIPIIIITAHAETPITVRAVKTGAVTVLEKPCRDYELVDAIQAALELDQCARKQEMAIQKVNHRLSDLTPKEEVVLDFMMDGTANKVIARRLGVSTRTVENRRQSIFEKTDTDSLAELVRLVLQVRDKQ